MSRGWIRVDFRFSSKKHLITARVSREKIWIFLPSRQQGQFVQCGRVSASRGLRDADHCGRMEQSVQLAMIGGDMLVVV